MKRVDANNTNVPPASKAVCDGIIWPKITGNQSGSILALTKQLERSQWLPADEIRNRQFMQLRVLAEFAAASSPFYKGRLDSLITHDSTPTDSHLTRIPIMTRQDLQNHEDQIRSTTYPESHGQVSNIRSSGSTGQPVGIDTNGVTGLFFAAINMRLLTWHRRDFRAPFAAIRMLNADERKKSAAGHPVRWVPAHASGPMHLFDITKPVAEQLEWLQRHDPVYLLTYPSNLKALLRLSQECGYRPSRLAGVNTMSEIVDDDLRLLCEDVWDVPIADAYSAIEGGMIALQCPEHQHYHVQSENLLVEVVGQDGRPCSPGETGKILITDLHNFAMPLIRYEIGDHAEVGKPCSCGRTLPVLSRIRGRTRNMVRFPNGDSAWPLPWRSSDFKEYPKIKQIQMVQRSTKQIDVNIVARPKLDMEEEAALSGYFSEMLGYSFNFVFHDCKAIKRSQGGKFEDFVCLIP